MSNIQKILVGLVVMAVLMNILAYNMSIDPKPDNMRAYNTTVVDKRLEEHCMGLLDRYYLDVYNGSAKPFVFEVPKSLYESTEVGARCAVDIGYKDNQIINVQLRVRNGKSISALEDR